MAASAPLYAARCSYGLKNLAIQASQRLQNELKHRGVTVVQPQDIPLILNWKGVANDYYSIQHSSSVDRRIKRIDQSTKQRFHELKTYSTHLRYYPTDSTPYLLPGTSLGGSFVDPKVFLNNFSQSILVQLHCQLINLATKTPDRPLDIQHIGLIYKKGMQRGFSRSLHIDDFGVSLIHPIFEHRCKAQLKTYVIMNKFLFSWSTSPPLAITLLRNNTLVSVGQIAKELKHNPTRYGPVYRKDDFSNYLEPYEDHAHVTEELCKMERRPHLARVSPVLHRVDFEEEPETDDDFLRIAVNTSVIEPNKYVLPHNFEL